MEKTSVHKVQIENINMPFWSLVGFMVKISLATIPALIILSIVIAILAGILGAFAMVGGN